MIGCIGHAISTEINIHDHEVEDARWFSIEQVQTMLEESLKPFNAVSISNRTEPFIPGPYAIAHHLLRQFVKTYGSKDESNRLFSTPTPSSMGPSPTPLFQSPLSSFSTPAPSPAVVPIISNVSSTVIREQHERVVKEETRPALSIHDTARNKTSSHRASLTSFGIGLVMLGGSYLVNNIASLNK